MRSLYYRKTAWKHSNGIKSLIWNKDHVVASRYIMGKMLWDCYSSTICINVTLSSGHSYKASKPMGIGF